MQGLSKLLYAIINSSRRELSTAEIDARARARTRSYFSYAELRGTLYRSTKIKKIKRKQQGKVRWYFAKLAA